MKRLVAALAAALLLCAPARCPADYLVTDLGGLGGWTMAYGINAAAVPEPSGLILAASGLSVLLTFLGLRK